MQSTKPPYTSIRNVPSGRLLGNADGATGPAQALSAVAARSLLGLGTAALAATGDFDASGAAATVQSNLAAHVAAADPHGDRAYAASLVSGLSAVYQPLDSDLTAIAALSTTTYGRAFLALADAAAGRSALGLAGLSTDASGVASLTGSAAAFRAYGPTGVPYASLSHDGTNGSLATSSGDVALSPASGVVSIPTASHMIKWGSAGTGLCLRLTAGSNPQLDVRDHTNSIYGRVRADTYFFNGGQYLYDNGTNFGFFHSSGAYRPVYTGNQRVYDTAANTQYLSLSHDGTNGNISTSSGSLNVGTNSRNTVLSGLWTVYTSNGAFQTAGQYPIKWTGQSVGLYPNSSGVLEINNGTAGAYRDLITRQLQPGTAADLSVGGSSGADMFHGWVSSNAGIFAIRSNGLFGASNSATNAGGAVDIAWGRRASGAWEANNGSAYALRDIYARTFYGIAQAATDTPGRDKGALSQSANLREWQDAIGTVCSTVSENGYFTTRKNSAPADAEIATGEAAYWFDSTNGAAKFMIKAKQADGTVVTGSVALA